MSLDKADAVIEGPRLSVSLLFGGAHARGRDRVPLGIPSEVAQSFDLLKLCASSSGRAADFEEARSLRYLAGPLGDGMLPPTDTDHAFSALSPASVRHAGIVAQSLAHPDTWGLCATRRVGEPQASSPSVSVPCCGSSCLRLP